MRRSNLVLGLGDGQPANVRQDKAVGMKDAVTATRGTVNDSAAASLYRLVTIAATPSSLFRCLDHPGGNDHRRATVQRRLEVLRDFDEFVRQVRALVQGWTRSGEANNLEEDEKDVFADVFFPFKERTRAFRDTVQGDLVFIARRSQDVNVHGQATTTTRRQLWFLSYQIFLHGSVHVSLERYGALGAFPIDSFFTHDRQ